MQQHHTDDASSPCPTMLEMVQSLGYAVDDLSELYYSEEDSDGIRMYPYEEFPIGWTYQDSYINGIPTFHEAIFYLKYYNNGWTDEREESFYRYHEEDV